MMYVYLIFTLTFQFTPSGNEEINFQEFMQLLKPKKVASKRSKRKVKKKSGIPSGVRASVSTASIRSSAAANKKTNSVVKLFDDLKNGRFGNRALPLPVLITAYRRKMLMNATMSKDDSLRREGQKVVSAIERTR